VIEDKMKIRLKTQSKWFISSFRVYYW